MVNSHLLIGGKNTLIINTLCGVLRKSQFFFTSFFAYFFWMTLF